jgi:hypothetical protein
VRFLRCALPGFLALACVGAWAEESGPVSDERPAPQHVGFTFEHPEILLRQRIFGLAHGVHLLVSSCLDQSEYAAATQAAYDVWYAQQHEAIATVRIALAEHHFGTAAARAHWQDIARALGLKETIYPSLGAVSLQEACATLPQALTQARYNFTAQLNLADDTVTR